ncbi:tetratricopeptide repeat protein [Deinococcus radiophilus]|nr:tetratricopeptide repeat protein [Deinococcus radiophilus]UFA49511.1 tetratricopeptide repeat protein [Deinococcus radiophilus]
MRVLTCLLLLALLPTPAQASPQPTASHLLGAPLLTLLTPDEVLELMDSGQLDEAAAAARKAVKVRPDSARARVVLARILARQGRLEKARAMLAEAQALPQWEAEDLGVPYDSPKEIDRVMQRDPARAKGMIADVLLAEGDDPKAHYLLALAEVQLGNYGAAQQALDQARAVDSALDFAHPDTLARLEELLRERPGQTAPLATPGLTPPQPLPWWVWGGVGVGTGALGWWGMVALRRASAAARAERERALFDAEQTLSRQIEAAQLDARRSTDPAAERRVERLRNLEGELRGWSKAGWSGDDIRGHFGMMLAASQSDAAWAAHKAELARQAAEIAASREAERHAHSSSDEPSSFRSGAGDSWSSGSSGSDSGGNNGGSSW